MGAAHSCVSFTPFFIPTACSTARRTLLLNLAPCLQSAPPTITLGVRALGTRAACRPPIPLPRSCQRPLCPLPVPWRSWRRPAGDSREHPKPPKQRCSVTGQQRIHPTPSQSVPAPLPTPAPVPDDHKEPKRPPVPLDPPGELMVTYFFCEEQIPYRRLLKSHSLTLGHFKEQLSKKGNYRYYFKKASEEFECGAVFEEIRGDDTMLPTYEGRVLGKVERID
ncbi:hypothetical protein XENTR_v10004544 [Xenopus tropicalis]|nr:hypothetical protein XENTR_v10004544 [Xenopus tropicalis]